MSGYLNDSAALKRSCHTEIHGLHSFLGDISPLSLKDTKLQLNWAADIRWHYTSSRRRRTLCCASSSSPAVLRLLSHQSVRVPGKKTLLLARVRAYLRPLSRSLLRALYPTDLTRGSHLIHLAFELLQNVRSHTPARF